MPPDRPHAVNSNDLVRRFLIVRLSAMGDIIHTLPVVAALRETFSEAFIGWVVEKRWAELINLCHLPGEAHRPLVDKVHIVNTKAWRRNLLSDETWREAIAAIRDIRCAEYDTVIDFQGAVRSALLARLSGATSIYGFAEPRENVAAMFYTHKIQARGQHIIEQNLSLASAAPGCDLKLHEVELASETPEPRATGHYAIINPGAGWGAKQWPAERYGEVAKLLSEQAELRSLINYGPGEENMARAAEAASGGTARPITGSIAQLISIVKGAQLFVGGDTGPMHLAAILDVPVVAIFGPTDPRRNGPYGNPSVVLRSTASATSFSHRKSPDEAMLEITPGQVLQAALQLLRDRLE
jgi:heptosyltransferase-1